MMVVTKRVCVFVFVGVAVPLFVVLRAVWEVVIFNFTDPEPDRDDFRTKFD